MVVCTWVELLGQLLVMLVQLCTRFQAFEVPVCFKGFFAFWVVGANKTSMPNMEFVLRRAPVVPWMTASALIGQDANPVAVFAELWKTKTPVQFRSYIRYFLSDHRPLWAEFTG